MNIKTQDIVRAWSAEAKASKEFSKEVIEIDRAIREKAKKDRDDFGKLGE